MLKHLLKPLSYLSIEHKQKWKVDWLYPFVIAAISTGLLFYFKRLGHVELYSDGALISKLLNFVQSLPGFYIAALAAIATFNKLDIDKTMPAPAPKLDIVVQGKNIAIELTRRRFLCSMFAFLTAESIILIVLAIFGLTFSIPVKSLFCERYHVLLSSIYIFIFMFLFWQMLVTSFWGLFYLGDRLHQPDQ